MSKAFDFIAQSAPIFGGIFTHSSGNFGNLELPVKLVDGRVIAYNLRLEQVGTSITAREEVQQHLPSFCPERHINSNGTFCLYYSEAMHLDIVDETSANAWLETVYRYLKLQERARVKRKWPNDEQWAHGEAASHQSRAEKAAAALGQHFTAALKHGHLQVNERRTKDQQLILDLWIEDSYIFSVWVNKERVIKQKQRCFCEVAGLKMPKRLRRCADHAELAKQLVFSLRDWKKSEELYWLELANRPCCGTCDYCPLASAS